MLAASTVAGTIPVVDLERAKTFYRDVLGLDLEQHVTGGILVRAGGGTQLYMYPREEATKAEHTAAHFMVEDLESVVDALLARGVTFETYATSDLDERGIFTAPNGARIVWLLDTEGNILGIVQPPAE